MSQTKSNKADPKNDPRKTRASSVVHDDTSEKGNEGKERKKSDIGGLQSTIPAMFRAEKHFDFEATLKSLETKISNVATKEYIEDQFKKVISEEFLIDKLEQLTKDLKNHIKEEVKTVYLKIAQLEKQVIQSEESVIELRDNISALQIELEKSKIDNEKLEKRCNSLEDADKGKGSVNKVYEAEINELEQYTRRNSVRIYGIDDRDRKESAGVTSQKVVQLLKNKLNLKVGEEDIDIAHRLGPFRADGNRPIICKFLSRMQTYDVIRARRELKGSGIVIREDLTIKKAKLLEKTSTNVNVKSAWSDDGKIIALLKSDRKVVVTLKTDLTKPLG